LSYLNGRAQLPNPDICSMRPQEMSDLCTSSRT